MHDNLLDLSLMLLTPTASPTMLHGGVPIPPDIAQFLPDDTIYVGMGRIPYPPERYWDSYIYRYRSGRSFLLGGAGNCPDHHYAIRKDSPADLRRHFGVLDFGFSFPSPPAGLHHPPEYVYIGRGNEERVATMERKEEWRKYTVVYYAEVFDRTPLNLSSPNLCYYLHQDAPYELFEFCHNTIPV